MPEYVTLWWGAVTGLWSWLTPFIVIGVFVYYAARSAWSLTRDAVKTRRDRRRAP